MNGRRRKRRQLPLRLMMTADCPRPLNGGEDADLMLEGRARELETELEPVPDYEVLRPIPV